jgi:hypothetical protein
VALTLYFILIYETLLLKTTHDTRAYLSICDLKMASHGVPEEYLDVMFQEFAYDPIRLPYAEDPAQLLYNSRTLETIWVTKHEAVNPYTFNIKNVIPQTELREEMHRYITKNRIPGLQVIPDYTVC